jgi:hypothetical protein
VTGIPNEIEFWQSVRRTGIGRLAKKHDALLGEIARAVRDCTAQGANTSTAILQLRVVRKKCVNWLKENAAKPRWEFEPIMALLLAAHERIVEIVCSLYPINHSQPVPSTPKPVAGLRTVGKHLGEDYHLERDLPSHPGKIDADIMKGAFGRSGLGGKIDLETFMKRVYVPMADDDPSGVYLNVAGLTAQHQVAGRFAFRTGGVKYCDADERQAHEVYPKAGKLFRGDRDDPQGQDEALHTGDLSTEFSGKGWAIYVLSVDNRIYAHSHVLNEFHHSSFLGGEFALAAGELAVDRGRLVAITCKTGHYKAGQPEFGRMLDYLAQTLGGSEANSRLKGVKACPEPWNKPLVWYDAFAVRQRKGAPAGDAVPPPSSPPVHP